MTIDIKRTVLYTQLRRFITLIVFCLIILLVILLGSLRSDILGLDKYSWALIIGLVYVITLIVESVLEFNYIYFNDEGSNIIFRYFSMSMFSRKKSSIEIPKNEFGGYKLQTYLWGLKKKIVLLHKFKDHNAPYPEVSLTGLSREELKVLLKTLDLWRVR